MGQANSTSVATSHLANFSIEYGVNGCGQTQCNAPIPGVYEGLNWFNFSTRAYQHIGSAQIQNLAPQSLYIYGSVGFEVTQATLSINGTSNANFDMQSLYFGCKPSDSGPGNQAFSYVSYPERCVLTVTGYKAAYPTANYDVQTMLYYTPNIAYGNLGYPYASMGFFNLTAAGNFTGLKTVVLSTRNNTGQPTFLGLDDVRYVTHT